MCVAIPHRVVGVHFTANGTSADIEVTGGVSKVDTSLLEEVKQGDYVLVFRGQALRVVSEEEAQQIQAALDCVQKVMDGGSAAQPSARQSGTSRARAPYRRQANVPSAASAP